MDLPVGSYGCFEGDVGESLCAPLGFSAGLCDVAVSEGDTLPPGFGTGDFTGLRFVARECWRLDV